jgi:hypothetical protein
LSPRHLGLQSSKSRGCGGDPSASDMPRAASAAASAATSVQALIDCSKLTQRCIDPRQPDVSWHRETALRLLQARA